MDVVRFMNLRLDVSAGEAVAAVMANEVDTKRVATLVTPTGCVCRPRPFHAPLVEGHEHGSQFHALVGEMVLVTRRMLGIHSALDYLAIFELTKTVREDVARCAGVRSDLIEAVHSVDEFADSDKRPPFPDDLQCRRHRTWPPLRWLECHHVEPLGAGFSTQPLTFPNTVMYNLHE